MAEAGTAPMESEVSEPVSRQLVIAYWLAEAARSSLAASGALTLVDDDARLSEASLVVVSTRVPTGSSAVVEARNDVYET